ncbi:MAG TPA: SulP family inorganic anion transporter [Chloroflexia bacterium]|nr:SulP family inorganic anion transporter [Chloroflexia bacterium]
MRLRQPALIELWRKEFSGYDGARFRRDLVAGLTVAAVALPLALAFGVASSATAAAGLVTAILAGFVIGALSGAPYQISGPTGAMAAVLLVVVQKHGLQGLWLAGVLAGGMLLLLGILRLGGVINFIPAPVITGFTSGIALIIFIGQIDNALGISTPTAETSAQKAVGYFTHGIPPVNLQAVLCAAVVAATMLVLPRLKLTSRWPAALAGIVLASLLAWALGWNVATIGEIPRTILLDERLDLGAIDLSSLGDLAVPAAAIAALGAIESLLAGTVAGRMTGTKLNANQELIAQGVGNMVIPLFGGVPATAAIARMSVGVKAGGITRMVSFVHSAALLVSALFLGGLLGNVPLAALAGVLMVTAWRMNEWHLIQFYVRRRLKSPTTVMLATLLATVTLDLTQAIIVGVMLSLLLFISQVSRLEVVPTEVDRERLLANGQPAPPEVEGIKVVYVSGPLFFGAAHQLSEALDELGQPPALILSMRGVPLMDASGLHAIEHVWHRQLKGGGLLYLTGLQTQPRTLVERSGLLETMGTDKFLWSADQAIRGACEELVSRKQAPGILGLEPEMLEVEAELEEMPLGVTTVEE